MEEDIKLVESLIKEFEVYGDLDAFEDIRPYMKAIKNILNRNKELEEENKRLFKEIDYTSVYLKATFDEREKWTSKIKEKIEELEKMLTHELTRNDGFSEYREYALNVLQDLLEKR